MRCFLAIELPKEVKDELYSLQRKIGKLGLKIKLVEKKNLHLTLRFFGELSEKTIEELRKQLKAIHFPSFSLHLHSLGLFSDWNGPRVAWVSVQPDGELLRLQKLLDAETLSFSPLPQKFQAHLTLGRIKLLRNDLFQEQFEKLVFERKTFSVSSFTLYKSTLTHEGPAYTVLETYPLSSSFYSSD
ncbi:RNA 2',3'-cyclic phosphodiesterase [Candidatus Woesearchaeota archaeon]|nr:RNA 2',3'-cyclic phosphodiesterase [Candidatus Woesearchaeota archaeon]